MHHCIENHAENKSILKPIKFKGRTKYKAVHFNLSGKDILVTPDKTRQIGIARDPQKCTPMIASNLQLDRSSKH